jgi:chorismate mutase
MIGLAALRDALLVRRLELVARLAAMEHLDGGLMTLLATVQGCLDAVAEFKKEKGQ